MLPKGFSSLGEKIKYIPKFYSKQFQPYLTDKLNLAIVQPLKSVVRLHLLKKAYNRKYSGFLTFVKSFAVMYCLLAGAEYDIGLSSVMGRNIEATEYIKLVERASQNSSGADLVEYSMKETIEKGKKTGLLAIELNQIAYLLEPYEIAWQGRYLASLKA